MPTLRETELVFAAAIRGGDCSRAAALIAPGAMPVEAAIGIYRDTFIAAATKALQLSHPAVERLTGAEFFREAAAVFIAGSPPASGCLDDYGAGFAEFLCQFEPAQGLPYLPDVARLERAVNVALHAPDAIALDAEGFAAAAAIDPARLLLQPHPSLSLLRTQYPADAVWRAVLAQDDAALAALSLVGGPFFLLAARGDDGLEVRRIPQAMWVFLSALCADKSFGEAFDTAASSEVPALLAECFAKGRFIAYRETET